MDIASLRKNYTQQSLEMEDVAASPFDQFGKWFQEAVNAQVLEPNAMTLATVTSNNKPTARTVLLKGFDENGFVFYTNYDSQKGEDLANNPNAALLFCWLDLERQIRIEGSVIKAAPGVSEAYFHSRPKSSQIGAWASPQSRMIESRSILEEKQAALADQYHDAEQLPLPPHWGGYVVRPNYFEFWQGRESRLHDRIVYAQDVYGTWKTMRLAP
jgi:pyridoxamine 5'-phosphate oxidase